MPRAPSATIALTACRADCAILAAAMAQVSFRDSIRLLRARRFGTYFVATLLSNLGTWAQQVAEPWLLLTLGASPFIIGLDGFALNGPV